LLHRVFGWDPAAGDFSPGGPLFNPRRQQGGGRHDNPDLYGALYLSRVEVSAIAEWLAPFRGQPISTTDLQRTDGRLSSIVGIDESSLGDLVDLDEPRELAARFLRPSAVATYDRAITQPIARALFHEGVGGFGWWSALEAQWPNVTLFAERVVSRIRVADGPRPLTIADPALIAAAAAVGVVIAGRPPGR